MNYIIYITYIGFLFSAIQGLISKDCKDNSPLCSRILKHCKTPIYLRLMQKHCALSCKFCSLPPNPTRPPLVRDRIHNCHTMIDQCNSEEFKAYMERNCKRTCSTLTTKSTTTTTISPDTTGVENIESSGIIDGDDENLTTTTIEPEPEPVNE
uniref:ShKT domain-containing protein n=1 Tax=Strongyloides stercoralis TaxID=6248 RepID=A0A0K0E003_STRER